MDWIAVVWSIDDEPMNSSNTRKLSSYHQNPCCNSVSLRCIKNEFSFPVHRYPSQKKIRENSLENKEKQQKCEWYAVTHVNPVPLPSVTYFRTCPNQPDNCQVQNYSSDNTMYNYSPAPKLFEVAS